MNENLNEAFGHSHPYRALLDLDGTVADYTGAMLRDQKALQSQAEIEAGYQLDYPWRDAPGWWQARARMIRAQEGWWRDLEPMLDGFDIYNLLLEAGFEVTILTKGPKDTPSAWTEKVQWSQGYLPGVPINVVGGKGGSEKAAVYGRVLVDDFPGYVGPWLDARPRGLVIMPDRPWNIGFRHPNCLRVYSTQSGLTAKSREDIIRHLEAVNARKSGQMWEVS